MYGKPSTIRSTDLEKNIDLKVKYAIKQAKNRYSFLKEDTLFKAASVLELTTVMSAF